MKSPAQKQKDKLKKEKLKARAIGNVYNWSEDMYDWSGGKKPPTGELKLFKKIAQDRLWNGTEMVKAKHITPSGFVCEKFIHIDKLTHWNFDHVKPKSRGKEYKLDPDNIEIVSVAYHFWKTNKQVLQIDYPN